MLVSDIEKHYVENRARYVKRLTFRAGSPEDAEDIIQEAYYRALKYAKSCVPDQFDRWFSTIINNCLRELKNQNTGHSADEFNEDEADGLQCPHYSNHVMREIYELIDTKSLVQQEVLNLYFKNEFTAVDISRITSYTYAQCHQIIQRFRKELKELYS